MGFIKGSVVFILAILLFISLFLSNLFLILNWSLSYENVAPHIKNITIEEIEDSGDRGEFLREYENKKFLCTNENSVNITLDSEEISIPCPVINKGFETSFDYALEKIIFESYYQEYDCSLIECLGNGESELVLVSNTAKEYWGEKFNITILISIALFLLIFLFVGGRHTAFTLAGIIVIVASFPFRQIDWLLSFFPEFLPISTLPLFFSESGNVFTLMLITGVLLMIVGMGLIFFKWGIKLNNFINSILTKMKKEEKKEEESQEKVTKEEVEKIVKEEIKKIKGKKSKKKK